MGTTALCDAPVRSPSPGPRHSGAGRSKFTEFRRWKASRYLIRWILLILVVLACLVALILQAPSRRSTDETVGDVIWLKEP
jgi:hypothetical protein